MINQVKLNHIMLMSTSYGFLFIVYCRINNLQMLQAMSAVDQAINIKIFQVIISQISN